MDSVTDITFLILYFFNSWFATGKINHFTKMGILSAAPETATDNYLYLPVILKAFGG